MARRIIARVLFAAVIVADLVLGVYVLRLYYLHPRTDDAYVRANTVGVAPQVSGTIVENNYLTNFFLGVYTASERDAQVF